MIREYRLKNNLTQEQLAEKLDIKIRIRGRQNYCENIKENCKGFRYF